LPNEIRFEAKLAEFQTVVGQARKRGSISNKFKKYYLVFKSRNWLVKLTLTTEKKN